MRSLRSVGSEGRERQAFGLQPDGLELNLGSLTGMFDSGRRPSRATVLKNSVTAFTIPLLLSAVPCRPSVGGRDDPTKG